MKILVACEYSGRVRDAFIKKGHEAISCDLLPTEAPGPHYKGSVFDVINYPWDMMIAHPPCTDIAVSGAAWFKQKKLDGRLYRSVSFFMELIRRSYHIEKLCIENPIGIMSTLYKEPDQIIQPWQFGHPETKATCLWLRDLPLIIATDNVKEKMLALPKNERMRLHYLPPSADRGKLRSLTYQGVADAMADQWGGNVQTNFLQGVKG